MPTTDVGVAWERLLFGVQRSVRYHARRQAFYDFWSTLTNAVTIIGGAGTVWAVLDNTFLGKDWRVYLPAVITVVATLNLVWGTIRSARLHSDLARRFSELEREMLKARPTAESLADFQAKRLVIEAEEPPVKFALDVLCHNELARAMGREDEYREVTWLQRAFAQVYAFGNADFPRKPAPKLT